MINQNIGFRVSLEEKERLKALAKQNNLKLSDYIRKELIESNQTQQLHQAIALLLLYNGCTFEQAALKEIHFIIGVFEEAIPRLDSQPSFLLNQLILNLSKVRTEVERKGESILNVEDSVHELWLNFLNPTLQE